MKDEEYSLENWLEGFAASPYTSNQLNAMKAHPDIVSAGEIKHLVKEVELLHYLLKALLHYSERTERETGCNTKES